MMKFCITYIVIGLSWATYAQQNDPILPDANAKFADKEYAQAEANYRVSQSKVPKYAVSSYNLGNAIYRQDKAAEAKFPYLKAIENAKTKPQKHKAFHNLGNVFMKEKNYSAAVEAYKNALRNDPADDQTRYNYALAKKMLKENPPKDDKNKDKKDDKKDKDKDKNKDKDKDKDKKDDKKDEDKDKKDGDKDKDKNQDKGDKPEQPKDDKSQGQPEPRPGDIPKERLEHLLDAVNNEEKKVQDKVNAKKVKGRPVQTDKDW